MSAKLKDPLPTCTLTEEECRSITYSVIKAVIPTSGIASVMATEMRDGRSLSGEAGVLGIFYHMGTSRTSLLLEQLFKDTPLGFCIRVCTRHIVLDAGMYGLLWKMKFPTISNYIANHSWVFAVLE